MLSPKNASIMLTVKSPVQVAILNKDGEYFGVVDDAFAQRKVKIVLHTGSAEIVMNMNVLDFVKDMFHKAKGGVFFAQ